MTNTGHGSARAPWARGRAKPRSSSIARSPVFERSRGVVQHAHQPWFGSAHQPSKGKKRGANAPLLLAACCLINRMYFLFVKVDAQQCVPDREFARKADHYY